MTITTGYPLQYIEGAVNFMGFELNVRPGVFIPRPETELVVEKVIDAMEAQGTCPPQAGERLPATGGRTHDQPRILDLCTGCGNIAISLAKFLKDVDMVASDISNEAIELAKENAKLHNCENIRFIKSDLFKEIGANKFDMIISNPPYISRRDFGELPKEVLHEPKVALYGGEDGLLFYRRILDEAPQFLKKEGLIILEIGYDQSGAIKEMVESKELFLREAIKDYNGIDRIMVVKPWIN